MNNKILDLELKIVQRDSAITGQQKVIDQLTKRVKELEAERDAAIKSAVNSSEAAFTWKAERDQFMEQAALRDQRDIDMQEIMRINNELKDERDEWQQAAHVEANLRREFLARAEEAEAALINALDNKS